MKQFFLFSFALLLFSSFNSKPILKENKKCPAFVWIRNSTSGRVIKEVSFYSQTSTGVKFEYINIDVQPGQTYDANSNGGLAAGTYNIVLRLDATMVGRFRILDYGTGNVLYCSVFSGFKKSFNFSLECGSYIIEVDDEDYC